MSPWSRWPGSILRALIAALLLGAARPSPAYADNCGGLTDCYGVIFVVALAIVTLALIVAVPIFVQALVFRLAVGAAMRVAIGAAARGLGARLLARPLLGRVATRLAARGGMRVVGRALRFTPKQLQSKYKHAHRFGLPTNYTPANAVRFQEAITAHVRDSGTLIIRGMYHGQRATHFYNPRTGINVIRDAGGEFLSVWRLQAEKLPWLLKYGKL